MSDPEMTLEPLRARIQEQAARRRDDVVPSWARLPPPVPPPYTFHWLEAHRRLDIALRMAHIAAPPELHNTRGPRRWAERFLAKVVTRLTRFITARQTDYNVCLYETAHEVADSLHDIERQVLENQERIRHLEACLAQLQEEPGAGAGQAERKAG
jgi:hypothetical protein